MPVKDIESQIDDIERNGISLAKYGGQNADEGRCRELCAMYLREFIVAWRMKQKLASLRSSSTRDDDQMSTKAQRKMRRMADIHGEQFALERAVLSAARVLRGAITLRGITGVSYTTWHRFLKAEDALNDFHADRQRRKRLRGAGVHSSAQVAK